MELRIINPSEESGFLSELQWNYEEVKAWVASRVEEYKNIAYTEDAAKDMKQDRAELNKAKTAIENERKRIKKLCMEPYERFERQVKEVTGLIDEPIGLIDEQLKEIEEKRKQQKQKDIEELFKTIGFQDFIVLERIMDPKWLNATVSLGKIEEQMKNILFKVGTEVATISSLPEFSFEALEIYKKTLDLNQAIAEGQRLAEIQKKKQQDAEQKMAVQPAVETPVADSVPVVEENAEAEAETAQADLIQMDFRVWATREQLLGLREYLIGHQIKFGKVE